MPTLYRQAMDALYRLCVIVAGSAMVIIAIIVPWGVFTRYILNSASRSEEHTSELQSLV